MAKVTTVTVVDDIDGTPSPDAETVTFSIEGKAYEIDLGPVNKDALFGLFAQYIEKGRPVAVAPARKAKAGSAGTGDADLVRRWAQENGIQVAARGRVSAALRQQYQDSLSA